MDYTTPPRKRTRASFKTYKKRTYRSKGRYAPLYRPRRFFSSGSRVGQSIGFPRMLKFQHKYVEQGRLSVGSSIQNVSFNCLGMYDPDPAVGGHQPLFFDQLTSIYNHYVVVGAICKWTFLHEGSGDYNPVRIICWYNDDTTVGYSNMNNIQEATGAQAQAVTMGGSSPPITVVQKYSAKKTWGGSILSNMNLQGTAAGNPPEGYFFHCSMVQFDPTGSPLVDVNYTVEITYIAIWKELREVPSS